MQGYNFTTECEILCAYYSATSELFYTSITKYLDFKVIKHRPSALIIKASKVARASNSSINESIVKQTLVFLSNEDSHKITLDDIDECNELFTVALPLCEVTPDQLINLVRPTIKKYVDYLAVDELVTNFSSPEAKKVALDKLSNSESIGVYSASDTPIDITSYTNSNYTDINYSDRMRLGVPELDEALKGGLIRKGCAIIVGESFSGKSYLLGNIAIANFLLGKKCLLISLEIPADVCVKRIVSNITGVPIEYLMDGSRRQEAKQKMGWIKEHVKLGTLHVKEFDSAEVSATELCATIDRYARELNTTFDVVVVDYLDELRFDSKATPLNEQHGNALLYLRNYARANDCAVFTASQLKRDNRIDKSKLRVITQHDVGDSKKKLDRSDMAISITYDKPNCVATFNIIKDRHGGSGSTEVQTITRYDLCRLSSVTTFDNGVRDERP